MSDPIDPLDAIAAAKGNWMLLGIRLIGAMTDPSRYNLSRSDEVLAEVARLRGQTTETLMNTVRAAHYILEHVPFTDEEFRDAPKAGVSHVNLLARLDKIDTAEVQTLKVRVFNGEMRYRALAAQVRKIQEATIPDLELLVDAPQRVIGRKRAKSFESALRNFLVTSVKDLTGKSGAIVKSGPKTLPIPVGCDPEKAG